MFKKARNLLKPKNAEGMVIAVMVETSFKCLISAAICVGVLQLLNLLAMFGLHRIEFVQLVTLKRLKITAKYAK